MIDLVIIGAGPGGYETAIKASNAGLSVVLIEEDKIGGTCLNHGCIPTKSYYRNSEVLKTLKESNKFGVTIDAYSFNFNKVLERKNQVVSKLLDGIKYSLDKSGVKLIYGKANLVSKNQVSVNDEVIDTKNIIIAIGSKVKRIPIEGIDNENVISSKEILKLNEVPKRLVVVGAGVVGLEFASIFNQFGSSVTVIEYLKNVLPGVDTDVSKRLKALMKKQNVEILTQSKLTSIEEVNEELTITFESKNKVKNITCDKVLLSVGREPSLESLNLDDVGIEYTNTGIKVNEFFQTNISNIYAIGDCIGGVMLAHTATFEGFKALSHIIGEKSEINFDLTPSAVFTFPEIASIGLTEDYLKKNNISYESKKYLFRGNGKALALDETDGFVKVIVNDKDEIIGTHIIGPHASDLIHEMSSLMNKKVNVDEYLNIIHAHPTLIETVQETIRQFKE